MKKLSLLIFLLAIFGISYTQNNTDFSTDTLPYFKKTNADIKQATNEQSNLRATSVFVDIGPSLFTLNGDIRFERKLNGFGMRAGIGYVNVGDDNGAITIPIMLNYLLGKNGKYFEIGAGATIVNNKGGLLFNDTYAPPGSNTIEKKTSAFGMMNFGYRRQPLYGGFLFRAGFAPVFEKDKFIPYIPYLSFGYSF